MLGRVNVVRTRDGPELRGNAFAICIKPIKNFFSVAFCLPGGDTVGVPDDCQYPVIDGLGFERIHPFQFDGREEVLLRR